jgi:hypothetical protein
MRLVCNSSKDVRLGEVVPVCAKLSFVTLALDDGGEWPS